MALFYHIVFTPKFRRKVIYNQYRSSLGEIFHRLCSYKGVESIEGHLMQDHVHMLVSIPPRISVSSFMDYLKRNYSVDDFFTSMKIWERVKHDIALDKLSAKEYEDPFRDSGK